jgi:membrane-bound lytic murein transglycosylase B
MSLSALLAACGSQPSNTHEQAGAVLAPVASAPASGVDAGLTTNAKAKPVSSMELPAIRPLNGNPEPDSYAYRDDARQLAAELAQSLELDPLWVWETLSKAKVKDSAAKAMMPAPVPTAKNWTVYRSRFVEPIRIRAGVNFWHIYEADLKRAESQYGVPAAIIAGVLGVETIYGRNTGNFRVLDVLMTLTLDFPKGRSDRSAFFKDELGQFLKLCQEQSIAPDSMLGSYAGAVGMPQFMPSSIRRYAVDFDGDGHIDLMRSPVDAIGSVAHYLAEHGWQSNLPTYYDIAPPRDNSALTKLLAPDILPSFSAKEMQELGANLSPSAQNHPGPLALVQLFNGQSTPTLIAGTANFYAITRYNQSSYYALAVIQLGDAVSREATRQNSPNP